jgi:hypothetical protein
MPALINHFELVDFFQSTSSSSINPIVNTSFESESLVLDLINFSFLDYDVIYNAATPYSFGTVLAIFLIFFNFLFKVTAAPFHF